MSGSSSAIRTLTQCSLKLEIITRQSYKEYA
jgi:hypothetical protein